MSESTEKLLERIIRMSAGIAEDRAPVLMDQARREAEEEVKNLVKSAVKAALLQRTAAALEREVSPPATVGDTSPPPVPQAPSPSAVDADSAATEAPREEDLAWYVYGVASGEAAAPAQGTQGVAARFPVQLVREAGLAAIASRVVRDDFTSSALQDRAGDLAWIEAKVRAHHAVLSAALSAGGLIPFRFGVVFSDRAGVERMLEERHEEFASILADLDGKTEWAVKIYRAEDAAAPDEQPSPASGDAPRPGEGREYLQRKQQDRDAQRGLRRRIVLAAEECHRRLGALADRTVSLPLQASTDLGRIEEMVLHAGYLLAEERREPFHELAGRMAEHYRAEGLLVEVTGPWPPYNFVERDVSREAAP